MDSNASIIFGVSLACLIVIDAMIVGDLYVVWIKRKRIELEIYKWRGTKKPLIWFLCWGLGTFINVVLFLALSLAFKTSEWVALACIISVVLSVVYFLAYNLTYHIIKSKQQ